MNIKQKILLLLIILLAAILRFWGLNNVPVSLFGDELDVGYQAYSILTTGRDYSGNLLPIHFRSLAEWRTPLYLYSSVPTVAFFGISPLGVRLPAAIFGILSIFVFYLLTKEITGKENVGLLAAFLLAISPWHLQYSRAGFEVTEMIFLYILGIYFFLRGLKLPKLSIWSAICLGLTPWVYSTAKLFLPLITLALLLIWWQDIKRVNKASLIKAVIVFVIVITPILWSTLFGGGTQRIEGISIFNDATVIPQIGFDRLSDVKVSGRGANITLTDKLFHNQPVSYSKIFFENYFKSFSTDFLFIHGDTNPRQSINTGEFYAIESIFLILGLIFLSFSAINKKLKIFLFFWLLASPIPSAFTKDGGVHATRLILMLPVLVIAIAYGLYSSYFSLSKNLRTFSLGVFSIILFLNFLFYLHNYYMHYPWWSEKWWHAGYEQAIKSAIKEGENYDRVIISSADEPSLKFFLGWSMYPPARFQTEYSFYISNETNVKSLRLGKYEFPPVGQGLNLYEMGAKLPEKTLYLATAKEINLNLIKDPGRMPSDLVLIKSIDYPSGEPAFYLFTTNEQ